MAHKPTYEELEQRVKELERAYLELKHVQEVFRESWEKYRAVFETAKDAIFVSDETGRFVDVNEAACESLGYSKEELLKLSNKDIDANQRGYEAFLKVRDGLAEKLTFEVNQRRKNGTPIPVEITGNFFKSKGQRMALAIARDISDRKQAEKEKKKLEAQLQQAQKLEAVGTLAGGIAHDFNNVLMGIQGYASLMLLNTGPDHPHFERLKGIEAMVQTGAGLTKQLLGFAMGGKYEVKSTDLNELVENSSEMFGRTKKEINIHRKHQENITPVEVDRGQIEQVLLNLYVNAWHAMPRGGNLYIETSNVVLDANYTKPFGVNPGNYVKMSVTDTGVGMGETTRQRIFDPFFTTKEMGRGTGLGLASAYGIIKNHGGIINVYSKKGEGTTFNIYLPVSEKEVATEERKPADDILKGTETVLLVDDEDTILDVGKQMLKEMGYKVFLAGSGREAVEIYKANSNDIALVILDMIMPDMGSGETYDILKRINPDITAILSSGYSINRQATEILERGCNGFIQKPFSIGDLSQKIREILNKQ
ncbi:MAG: PAS domain S-box protein [Deltaproteobacteria bacterium]|nr:PAS domain S-box protein [Deltaproteobacteria bacterium]